MNLVLLLVLTVTSTAFSEDDFDPIFLMEPDDPTRSLLKSGSNNVEALREYEPSMLRYVAREGPNKNAQLFLAHSKIFFKKPLISALECPSPVALSQSDRPPIGLTPPPPLNCRHPEKQADICGDEVQETCDHGALHDERCTYMRRVCVCKRGYVRPDDFDNYAPRGQCILFDQCMEDMQKLKFPIG